MFAVIGRRGGARASGQRGPCENLANHAIGQGRPIAAPNIVIPPATAEDRQMGVEDGRVKQRAIASHAHHHRAWRQGGGGGEAAQDIVLVAAH